VGAGEALGRHEERAHVDFVVVMQGFGKELMENPSPCRNG